jgi:hypothetical protein
MHGIGTGPGRHVATTGELFRGLGAYGLWGAGAPTPMMRTGQTPGQDVEKIRPHGGAETCGDEKAGPRGSSMAVGESSRMREERMLGQSRVSEGAGKDKQMRGKTDGVLSDVRRRVQRCISHPPLSRHQASGMGSPPEISHNGNGGTPPNLWGERSGRNRCGMATCSLQEQGQGLLKSIASGRNSVTFGTNLPQDARATGARGAGGAGGGAAESPIPSQWRVAPSMTHVRGPDQDLRAEIAWAADGTDLSQSQMDRRRESSPSDSAQSSRGD